MEIVLGLLIGNFCQFLTELSYLPTTCPRFIYSTIDFNDLNSTLLVLKFKAVGVVSCEILKN